MKKTLLTIVLSSYLLLTPLILMPLTATQVLPGKNYVDLAIQNSTQPESLASDLSHNAMYWTNIWDEKAFVSDRFTLSEGKRALSQVKAEQNAPVMQKQIQAQAGAITPAAVKVYAPATSYDEVYKQAGEKYGVPWQILYGLHITESGGRNGPISNGRGPQGPMQFMPGTWKAYAVDGDGDGVADINNANDAIYGAANYLAKHGSLAAGLRAYDGNTSKTLALARERGYSN